MLDTGGWIMKSEDSMLNKKAGYWILVANYTESQRLGAE
jgi:hypothetical protein